MEYKDIIIAILTGGVAAAVVKFIADAIAWRRNRNAEKADKEEEDIREWLKRIEKQIEQIEEKNDAQSEALKFVLYDRIRDLGRYYISQGNIDIDDRRIFNEMHSSYHDGLHADGDLDVLKNQVNTLPLKIEK